MRNGLFTGLLLATIVSPAFACDMEGRGGIVEDNKLWIGVHDKEVSTITEERFNVVLDRVEKIYAPIIEALGKKLVINRNWADGTVNAYAQQTGNNWLISMFGGLARHATITEDGFALVACHETGHHLGGAPRKASFFGSTWASNEGQADYWGTMKCLRKYFEGEDNIAIVAKMEVDPIAKAKCAESFSNAEDVAVCERGAMAGLSLGNLFKALSNGTVTLKFDTPDPARVTRTNDNHPASQCRLDTYFNGSLCDRCQQRRVYRPGELQSRQTPTLLVQARGFSLIAS